MKAAVRYRYGSPDVVGVIDIEQPQPGPNEVLVRVVMASVNRADLDGLGPRPGFARLFMGLRVPRTPRIGLDVAGVVEAVGDGVTRLKSGDRVFADMFSFGQGAFAEFVCAAERAFLPIPDGMSFEVAASLPHSGVLALQALRLRSGRTIEPGNRVLIDGASGNVGPFAVQIAKAWGAEVTGVCRGEKLEFVRSLGADQVIDYTQVDYTRSGQRYDWIVDTDSHHPIRDCRRALRRGGAYVTLGGTGGPILSALLMGPAISLGSDRWMGLLLWWKPFNPPDVAVLAELIADGKVKPAIDRSFPLAEARDALRYVDQSQARGKVLITI